MSIFLTSPGAQRPYSRSPWLPRLEEDLQPDSERSYGSKPIWKISLEDILSAMVLASGEQSEAGPSSNSSSCAILCGICGEELQTSETLSLRFCKHIFCVDCLRRYTLAKIHDQRYPIACPGCLAERASYDHMSSRTH